MRMLAGKLRLLDIDDVEALARDALNDRLRRWRIVLNERQYEDLLSYLVALTWELSARYDPARDRAREKGREPSFAGYAGTILRLRVVDWFRGEFGRAGGRGKAIVLSLDEPERLSASRFADDDDGFDARLVDTLVDASAGLEDRVADRLRFHHS